MTENEVLNMLHEYTPWEMLHMKHPSEAHDMERVNRTLEQPVTEEEKSYGLHLPRFTDPSNDTFSEENFFRCVPGQDIMIVQHDRYTPPVLHNHDFFELLYVYEGEFTQQIGGSRYLMHTGDFCLIPPRIYHSLDIHNYSVVLNILIPKTVMQTILIKTLHGDNKIFKLIQSYTDLDAIQEYIIFHTGGDSKVRSIVLDMCMECLNRDSLYNHMLNANFLLLLGLLLRNFGENCDSPKIKRTRDSQDFDILQYMEANYKTLTLQELAEQFHYSTQYMSLRIRQITGISFTKYLLQKRMQAASDLLMNTNIKISVISESIGYRTQEHFIRTFKKYFGVAPNTYRSTQKASNRNSSLD